MTGVRWAGRLGLEGLFKAAGNARSGHLVVLAHAAWQYGTLSMWGPSFDWSPWHLEICKSPSNSSASSLFAVRLNPSSNSPGPIRTLQQEGLEGVQNEPLCTTCLRSGCSSTGFIPEWLDSRMPCQACLSALSIVCLPACLACLQAPQLRLERLPTVG